MRATALRWQVAVLVPLALAAFSCSKNPTSPSTYPSSRPGATPRGEAPAPAPEPGPKPPPGGGGKPLSLYLHGIGANANPATLALDEIAPAAATEKYKDSPAVKFSGGNAWVQVGTWSASPKLTIGTLTALGDLQLWLGLKNSDDIGTQFDVRAEVLQNGAVVAAGETSCIPGITRNPALAKAVGIAFAKLKPVPFGGKETLSLRLLTRIGTDGAGVACGGHNSATGLRVYFDATSRAAMFDAVFGDARNAATLIVTVIEKETNAPIPNSTVNVFYDDRTQAHGTTDGNGEAVFTNQPIGVASTVEAVLNDGSGRKFKQPLAAMVAGDNSVLLAAPPLTATLTVFVVTPLGESVPSGVATLSFENGATFVQLYAEGAVSFSGMPVGVPGTVTVTTPNGDVSPVAILLPVGVSDLTVAIGLASVSVRVTVFEPDGVTPAAGATVTMGAFAGTTDASGQVTFTNVPVGAPVSVEAVFGSEPGSAAATLDHLVTEVTVIIAAPVGSE